MRDNELFDGVTLKTLFRDIYDNQVSKKQEINELVATLAKLITRPDDVAIIGPVLQQFVDTGVKNDEQLVKMANIIQRFVAAEMKVDTSSDGMLLTEMEKETLLKNAMQDLSATVAEVEDELINAKSKLNT